GVAALFGGILIVSASAVAYYAKGVCPGCGSRWLSWQVYLHARKDGGADRRYKHNPLVCSACGRPWDSEGSAPAAVAQVMRPPHLGTTEDRSGARERLSTSIRRSWASPT